MPASTFDPVNAALRTALTKNNGEGRDLDAQLAGSTKKALLANIDFEAAGSYHSTVLEGLKSKYIVVKSTETAPQSHICKADGEQRKDEDVLAPAKRELYPQDAVKLGWDNGTEWSVGAGMVNMGNTCYLNSTLQALFHVPSLVNWLMSDKDHAGLCQDSGGMCIICAMRKTLQESQQRNVTSIRPILIYNKLRLVCRNLIPGRQEDAHEFLRYLVEAMEKSYLQRFKNYAEFDSKVKETTPLNQILGGYLRSAVRCLRCGHVSTTFQHFQDLLLDIRKAQTVAEALELYFSREKLDDESYQCEACQKKVPATKQFSIERAPMVLCVQLKRFSVSNNKITKHVTFRQRLDLTRFARQKPHSPLIYRLVALVTHMGPTVSCGHYTAVAQAPSGNFYQFDDSMVRPISHQTVFNTNAYIMLYELESAPTQSPKAAPKAKAPSTITEPASDSTAVAAPKIPNGVGFTSDKMYGPELPPPPPPPPPVKANGGLTSTNGAAPVTSSSCRGADDSSGGDSSEEEAAPKPASPPVKEPDSSTAATTSSRDASPDSASPKKTSISPSKSLVPYDTGDTSSSDDSNHSESKTTVAGEWQVTSSTDVTQREPGGGGNVVSDLYKMSNSTYATPVFTWNGTRSQLDKEVGAEKRDDRKRHVADSSGDQGRAKHPKITYGKSNPGYNPIQEYHNAKNWSNGSSSSGGYHKPFYGGNRHRRGFHHKGNFHKNNYRFR